MLNAAKHIHKTETTNQTQERSNQQTPQDHQQTAKERGKQERKQ